MAGPPSSGSTAPDRDSIQATIGDRGRGIAVGRNIHQFVVDRVEVHGSWVMLPIAVLAIAAGVAVSLVLFQVWTIVQVLVQPPPIVPPGKEGSFVVAVAQFALENDPDRHGAKIAAATTEFLNRQFDEIAATRPAPSAPPLRGYAANVSNTVAIRGNTFKDREEQAERWLKDHDIKVLLYGQLGVENNGFVARPEFYLRRVNLRDEWELSGEYQLGTEINEPTLTDTARDSVSARLAGRAVSLAHLARAADAIERDAQQAAQQLLVSVADQWDDPATSALFYHFAGSVAGQRGHLGDARELFLKANERDPTLPRPFLGLGEVTLAESKRLLSSPENTECESGHTNDSGLHEAIGHYQTALGDQMKPTRDLQLKADFGLGRAYVCLSYAGADEWQRAEKHLQNVISAFEGGNTHMQQFAAESYAQRGIVRVVEADAAEPGSPVYEERLRLAAADYCRAIRWNRYSEQTTEYRKNLQDILEAAGDRDLALRDCRNVLADVPSKLEMVEGLR
jgi:tetratricopeptide (TPR) repeat protein